MPGRGEAAGLKNVEAYSLEYVEDCFGPTTTRMPADRFPQQNGFTRTDSWLCFDGMITCERNGRIRMSCRAEVRARWVRTAVRPMVPAITDRRQWCQAPSL